MNNFRINQLLVVSSLALPLLIGACGREDFSQRRSPGGLETNTGDVTKDGLAKDDRIPTVSAAPKADRDAGFVAELTLPGTTLSLGDLWGSSMPAYCKGFASSINHLPKSCLWMLASKVMP